MSTKTITGPHNEVTIVHSNPAEPPLAPGAGTPVVAATKIAGNPNGTAHGQVTGTNTVFHNPA